jgi:hypothetical protein
MQPAEHWHRILSRQSPEKSSWFVAQPRMSLQLIKKYARSPRTDSILDAGGGASTLAESLLKLGYGKVTVVDWAPACLDWTYRRLGAAAERYQWVCGDVTTAALGGPHTLWHDRGCMHYMTLPAQHQSYANAVRRGLIVGGHVVVGAYGRGGPQRASGLAVNQFSHEGIAQAFGPAFKIVETQHEQTQTPMGRVEPYLYAVLQRVR